MIPLFRPSCTDAEVEAVTRVLRSGWWGQGAETAAFEAEFAAYTDSQYAVAVNSGTSALELSAREMYAGEKNVIAIVPSLTFVSTGLAMKHAGHQVAFADIDEDTLVMDWDSVRKILAGIHEDAPVILVPVWYGGTVVPIPRDIKDRCLIIEDCAHAAGSTWAGKQGDLGDAAAWSFHAVKNLATGDGGMITTDSWASAERLKHLRWCGINKSTYDRDHANGYGWDYDIPADGEKAHMNDITAAIGRVQLRRLATLNRWRRDIASHYNRQFKELSWLKIPVVSGDSSTHLYVVRVAADKRADFIQHLRRNGVSAGVHYKPLTHYENVFSNADKSFTPVAERVWQTLVTLPLFPDMTAGEIEQVTDAVRSFKG